MPLTLEKLNQSVVDAKYAVRGRLALRAEELRQEASKPGSKLPFDHVVNSNIGNPQQLDQKPITFYRQVLAMLEYPDLIGVPNPKIGNDARERAKKLLEATHSVGAYSHSKGVPYVREAVAKFIEERDGFPANPEHIYLTTGASAGVSELLHVMAQDKSSGFLIPIPQYPLYSATLTLVGATAVSYYLKEDQSWATDANEIAETIEQSRKEGIELRSIVVINPGNPTGAILKRENIEDIIKVAAKYHLVIIADEVYQANVYEGEFISFKKVLRQMQQATPGIYDHVELASLHTTSKGLIGECGHRGGYMELVGFSPEVEEIIYKLASISLCPPVIGQALVELMINPPKTGEDSYELFKKETDHVYNTLKSRANQLYEAFQNMEGVSCAKPEGAMYLYPKITLPPKVIEAAKAEGHEADEYYCMHLLEETGICVIPGSGFGQEEGTFHFRSTFLAPGDDVGKRIVKFHNEFIEKYK